MGARKFKIGDVGIWKGKFASIHYTSHHGYVVTKCHKDGHYSLSDNSNSNHNWTSSCIISRRFNFNLTEKDIFVLKLGGKLHE